MAGAAELADLPSPAMGAGEAAAWVDRAHAEGRDGAWWAGLLAEQGPLFAGRGAGEADRLRAHVLAGFRGRGLPDDVLPFVVEDLTYSRDPRGVAAAAVALQAAAEPPAEAAALLRRAVERILPADDVVRLDVFDAAVPPQGATAAAQVLEALAGLGSRAAEERAPLAAWGEARRLSPAVREALGRALAAIGEGPEPGGCCASRASATPTLAAGRAAGWSELGLEDQAGVVGTIGELFAGAPSAIAFFYTRCMTPEKCSLTVSRLGELRRWLDAQAPGAAVNVAGISYDPGYDDPDRLTAFGAARGLAFDARTRLLRTTGPFEPVRAAFDLGVGYGPATVNRHRLDLVVLDAELTPREQVARTAWDVERIGQTLLALRPVGKCCRA